MVDSPPLPGLGVGVTVVSVAVLRLGPAGAATEDGPVTDPPSVQAERPKPLAAAKTMPQAARWRRIFMMETPGEGGGYADAPGI